MRTDYRCLQLCCVLLAVTALVVVSGCPATMGPGAGGPATSGSQLVGGLAGGTACQRSLDGDLKTAKDRLDRGHPEEALEKLKGWNTAYDGFIQKPYGIQSLLLAMESLLDSGEP